MDKPRHRFVIRPNGSMSNRLAAGFMAGITLVSGSVAAACWMVGLWPVVPFVGLELGALAAALWHCARYNQYREVVSVGEDLIRVEAGLGRPTRVREFSRHWARIELEAPRLPHYPSRLWLRANGRSLELGACLTEDERRALAARLRNVVCAAA